MTTFAGTADATAQVERRRSNRPISRGWEIAGIVLGFVFAWPLAVAYLVWKFAGYPVPEAARAFVENRWGWGFGSAGAWMPAAGTGNSAFEEYRRSELRRLEEERRRLDEESRAFSAFVEELKRAKDREEFDAFMAKRRAGGQTS